MKIAAKIRPAAFHALPHAMNFSPSVFGIWSDALCEL